MKAVILAAGKGNRLKPHTETIPKPLLSLKQNGEQRDVVLTHILTQLPSYVDEAIIVVKYLEDFIRNFILDHSEYIHKANPYLTQISCVTQTGEKGTMGALLTVKDFMTEGEKFLVLNGDDLHTREELEMFNRYPRAFGVHKKIMPGYKSVMISETGVVSKLESQTEEELQNGCLIATGTYLLDKNFFDFEPVILIDGEIGLPQTLIAHADVYQSYAVEEKSWFSINTPDDLLNLWKTS